ncbi:sortase [Patescibacteria group bacterium]
MAAPPNHLTKRKWVFFFFGLGLGFLLVFLMVTGLFSLQKPILEEKKAVSLQRVKIPSLEVDLAVFPSSIDDGQWDLFDQSLSYLRDSPEPGQKGNIVVYGHNQAHLLEKLPQVKEGDRIILVDSVDKEWLYLVGKTLLVSPKAIKILEPLDYPGLTVYTCAGWQDKKRFVVRAKLI